MNPKTVPSKPESLFRLAACTILAACLAFAAGAHASGAAAEPPGRGLYLKYCSACHGAGGKGDGAVSGFLKNKPTDLTQMAKKASGQFPYMEVMRSIDGTKTVRAHGDPDMPVWGELFRDEISASMDQRVAVQGKLMLLTEHIRSIQEK